jgi:hypothetical protein
MKTGIMIRLNLPTYDFRIMQEGESAKIWDEFRKKYVALTPEEWVRQHIIRYLAEDKHYPRSLIMIESGLKVNRLFRRVDALVYDRGGTPIMLIECKSAGVKVTQEVFDQIARYNIPLRVPYLLVTNGLKHFCCRIDYDSGSYMFLKDIPDYQNIQNG